jgi:hypothetical protein
LPAIADEFLPRDFDLHQLLKEPPAVLRAAASSEVPEFAP